MSVKFKNQNNTLKIFCYTDVSIEEDDYSDEYEVTTETYHISANSIEEAVEIYINKFTDIEWHDKTREDFSRQDYYDAWIDHNREKTRTSYLNKLKRETKKLMKEFKEIPGVFYIGKPGVLLNTKVVK